MCRFVVIVVSGVKIKNKINSIFLMDKIKKKECSDHY